MTQFKFFSKEPINKGWSGDKKYCVTDEQGNKFFLRVFLIEQYEQKKSEYELMSQTAALGTPMCKPLEFGVSDEGVYSVQTWIDGVDAREVMGTLSDSAQYTYGFESGRILRKIHSIATAKIQTDWEIRYNYKIDCTLKKYNDCPLKFENGEAFVNYINANRPLLKYRPQVYQHGDFHIGNMMIGNDGKLYIIDFERNDFGDPWEDMKAITWDVAVSPIFASGRINGYFDNNIPDGFWHLLALYISCGTLGSLPWAMPFGDEEIETMQNLAKEILSWYDNMRNPVPTWYKGVI